MTEEVNQFNNDGYLLLQSIIDENIINTLYCSCLNQFEEYNRVITDKKLDFGVGIKNGYKEIVQRHPMRYEMPFDQNNINIDNILNNVLLNNILDEIFQSNYHIINTSFVISLPNAKDQGWHTDGPHFSVNEHLPCHCLNVFISLLDMSIELGPTELRPGSHKLTRDMKKLFLPKLLTNRLSKSVSPILNKGHILMFDYRILHRGLENKSNQPRPVLVITFAKNWFKDVLNFPKRSIFDEVV